MSSPLLIQLAAIGLLAAVLPLAIVLASRELDKYRKLVWVTLFLTFDLIMFGAFTRLTDSGLGCPDWPGCYGQADPVQAHADISAAEAAMPTGPVTVVKAWIEMIHRYLAMGIGVLIVALMALAWHRRLRSGSKGAGASPLFPTLLFAFVCLQGAFGAWTVTMKLQPLVVTGHLVLGMSLLALLTWLAASSAEHEPVAPSAGVLRIPGVLAIAALMLLIALGGWVSSNYAGLACADFPFCNGEIWPSTKKLAESFTHLPPMDFARGFTLWRELGRTPTGEYLPLSALTAIHWTHRVFALAVVMLVALIALKALKVQGLRKTARWLLAALALQFASGVLTVFLGLPLALAVVHNGGAALLLLLLTMLNYKSWMVARSRHGGLASALPGTLPRSSCA